MKSSMAGWIAFAGILMMIIGGLDAIQGLVAIIDDNYYVSHSGIVFESPNTWGWVMLIWGIVLVLGGMALWGGSGFGRWFGVVLVSLNTLGQLSWLGASSYPLWTLTIVALNIIVLYALVARWEGYSERTA